mgnify:CR=1 FL=1
MWQLTWLESYGTRNLATWKGECRWSRTSCKKWRVCIWKKCADSLAGKWHWFAFKNQSSSKRTEILELIHCNVCGLVKVGPLDGARYVFTAIDDFSWKVRYIFTSKDQVLDKSKNLKLQLNKIDWKESQVHSHCQWRQVLWSVWCILQAERY